MYVVFFHSWKCEEDLHALVCGDRVAGVYFPWIHGSDHPEARFLPPFGPTMGMLSKVQFLILV